MRDSVNEYTVHPQHLYQPPAGAQLEGGAGRGGGSGNGINRGGNNPAVLRAQQQNLPPNINQVMRHSMSGPQQQAQNMSEALQQQQQQQQQQQSAQGQQSMTQKPPDMKQQQQQQVPGGQHMPQQGAPPPNIHQIFLSRGPPYNYNNSQQRPQTTQSLGSHRAGQNPSHNIINVSQLHGGQPLYQQAGLIPQTIYAPTLGSGNPLQFVAVAPPQMQIPYGSQNRPQPHTAQYGHPGYSLPYGANITFGFPNQSSQPYPFYQQSNPAVMNRTATASVGAGAHHMPGQAGPPGAGMVSPNPLQQAAQQHQPMPAAMPTMSVPQSEASPYTNQYQTSVPQLEKTAKKRDRAIAIVDPDTGRNISIDDILKESMQTQQPQISVQPPAEPNPLIEESKKKVAADFASQVAKVASEPLAIHKKSSPPPPAEVLIQSEEKPEEEKPKSPSPPPCMPPSASDIPDKEESNNNVSSVNNSSSAIVNVVDDCEPPKTEEVAEEPKTEVAPPVVVVETPPVVVVKEEPPTILPVPQPQPPKSSKTKKNKYRDLNLKEEGSEMDAFVALPDKEQKNTENEDAKHEQESEKPAEKAEEIVVVEEKPEQTKVTDVEENIVEEVKLVDEDEIVLEDKVEETITTASQEIIEDESSGPVLKYQYDQDQWSPINILGKKVYGRQFLMILQGDPISKIKPSNLPDLDVVLKDNAKSNRNNPMVQEQFRTLNAPRHLDANMPGFMKNNFSKMGGVMSSSTMKKRDGDRGNKLNKPPRLPNLIHYTLPQREDIKLRESENAWKPTRLDQGSKSDEQLKSEALYKKVRSVLNKLTPQKFLPLVDQVKKLPIDTQERLQGVIDLVFEKAIDEPNFAVEYAMLCKELSSLVIQSEGQANDAPDSNTNTTNAGNFRRLILTRCQNHFEKTTFDENLHNEKVKEIEECSDLERRKELQITLDDEERRMRLKSVGNIRFVGELFKLNMLTANIMHTCIKHLLKQTDEENLECLCKLLTTIGKALDAKKPADLDGYFKMMETLSKNKVQISSRIRFMLQDVMDLRRNAWVPRRDDAKPKTIDQINKDVEAERIETQMILSQPPMNTPQRHKDTQDRYMQDKKRGGNRGQDEWQTVSQKTITTGKYNVETHKLKTKQTEIGEMSLGNRSMFQMWNQKVPNQVQPPKQTAVTTPNKYSMLENMPQEQLPQPRNSHSAVKQALVQEQRTRTPTPPLSTQIQQQQQQQQQQHQQQQQQPPKVTQKMDEGTLVQFVQKLLEEYKEENDMEAIKIKFQTIPQDQHDILVQEMVNTALDKSDEDRKCTSQLLVQLFKQHGLSVACLNKCLANIFKVSDDLLIDIPMAWVYLAKVLVLPVVEGLYKLRDLNDTVPRNLAGTVMAELMQEMSRTKDVNWAQDKWQKEGLRWQDLCDDPKDLLSAYKLEFLSDGEVQELNWDQIEAELTELLRLGNFDNICFWITKNVGENRVKEPKFIRLLMTAILEQSCDRQEGEEWRLNVENFDCLSKLIQRYVDADEKLELLCLFAIQAVVHKKGHPPGLISKVVTRLHENVLSNEAFLAWEKNNDPEEAAGKQEALESLTDFFIILKEADDVSSDDEP